MKFQDIYDLYIDAKGGDWSAENMLREAIRREAKRANRQMLRVKKSDFVGSESYYRARDYLKSEGRKGFMERTANKDIDVLIKEAEQISSYVNATDYSFGKKERARLSKYSKVLGETFGLSGSDTKESMARFLSSSAWSDYKHLRYVKGSGTLNDIAELVKDGTEVDDILDSFRDWQQGGLDIIELEEIWRR